MIVGDEYRLRKNIEKYFIEQGSIGEGCKDLRSAFFKVAVYRYDYFISNINLLDGEGYVILGRDI